MHFVYVIYSPLADSYYIGETVNVEERLIQHCQHTYAGSYTKIADDWEVAFLLRCKGSRISIKRRSAVERG